MMKSIIKRIDVSKRELSGFCSTQEIDRDNEIILVDGWRLERYEKNPVVLYAHDYRSLPIGRATSLKRFKAQGLWIKMRIGEHEAGETVMSLVSELGFASMSVGFLPLRTRMSNVRELMKEGIIQRSELPGGQEIKVFEAAELLEVSLVPVPSNPSALIEQNAEGMITKSVPDPQAFAEQFNEGLLRLTLKGMDLPQIIAKERCRLWGMIVEADEGKEPDYQQALSDRDRRAREREIRRSQGAPFAF